MLQAAEVMGVYSDLEVVELDLLRKAPRPPVVEALSVLAPAPTPW